MAKDRAAKKQQEAKDNTDAGSKGQQQAGQGQELRTILDGHT